MVAKFIGLATGALVASIGVWAFNDWRHVSDEDRFTDILRIHCVPYVQTGQTPFDGMGRPVGVYDRPILSDNLTDGGSLMLFSDRFVAQWGEGDEGNARVRACTVNYNIARDGTSALEVTPDKISDLVNAALPDAGLVAVGSDVGTFPRLLNWQSENPEKDIALLVMLTALENGVTNILVIQSFAD